MANNIQKDAGVMDYVDSAVSSGGRFLKDVYRDVLSPAGRNMERIVGSDVVDPAVRKIKEVVGPRWNDISRFGRRAKNYVMKGLTGLNEFGSDAYNTARGIYNSSEAIGNDLSKAYGRVRSGLGGFAARYKRNSGNTLGEVKRLLNKHWSESSDNLSELGSDLQGVLGDAWGSIHNKVRSGMNKSSSMQKDALFGLGFLGRMAARRTMTNARKMLPTTRAIRNRANPGKTVNGTPEGIPDMTYNGPTNANFNSTVPNTTVSTPPAVPQPSAAPAPKASPGRGGRARGRRRGGYGAGSNIVNNIHVGNGASPAIAAAGHAPGGSAANWANTAMNGLMLGGMGYNMIGGGGEAAAAAAPAEMAQLAAANPGMYMPQTSYANWAAGNNVLKGLYM